MLISNDMFFQGEKCKRNMSHKFYENFLQDLLFRHSFHCTYSGKNCYNFILEFVVTAMYETDNAIFV